jgi:hypothetical protein
MRRHKREHGHGDAAYYRADHHHHVVYNKKTKTHTWTILCSYVPRDSTVTFGERDCDLTIPNHWGLDEFRGRLLRLARFAGLPLRT